MGSRFDQNPDPSFVIEPDPISEQRWPDDGRRCRGEPPLRGGHFFKSLQPLGCCSNLWGDCVAIGMLSSPLESLWVLSPGASETLQRKNSIQGASQSPEN